MKLFILIIFLILNLIFTNIIQNQKTCKKFVCSDDLSIGTCLSYNFEEEIINLRKCTNQNEVCPILKQGNGEYKCMSKETFKHQKVFPGGKCLMDEECIYGACQSGFCKGKELDETCEGHNQCPYKSSCRTNGDTGNKVCTALSSDGGSCTDDFDCLNNLGCHMGSCIPYLSLPTGTEVNNSIRNAFPLCESGFAYNGKCDSLKSKNEGINQCSIENNQYCNYITSTGEEIEIKDACLCGKNPQALTFCALGNNSSEWVEYLGSLRQILSFNFDYCNTLERTLCKFSIDSYKKQYERFIINSINATKHHELIGADTCIIDIFYPMLNEDNRTKLSNRMKNFRKILDIKKDNDMKSFLKK